MKFKPIYTVYIDEQEIGNINNKKIFKTKVEENLFYNEKDNIAFSDIYKQIKYRLKLVPKQNTIEEEKTLLALKEKADITYFEYAICVDGVEKQYVKTQEEANKIQQELIQQLEETNVAVTTVYTKNLENVSSEDTQTISKQLIAQVKQEQQDKQAKEKATINGIYLAVKPVSGNITSRYGAKESIRDHTHQGLDIGAKAGTPIKAVADGKITQAGVKGGYGNLIIIDHGNGIQTYYGHCSKLYVKTGEQVTAGDTIGAVGSTGNSTGPHLHFEIRQNGKYVNPANYLY